MSKKPVSQKGNDGDGLAPVRTWCSGFGQGRKKPIRAFFSKMVSELLKLPWYNLNSLPWKLFVPDIRNAVHHRAGVWAALQAEIERHLPSNH